MQQRQSPRTQGRYRQGTVTRLIAALGVLSLFGCGSSGSGGGQGSARFTALGLLQGGSYSHAFGVSSDGSTVVGTAENADGDETAFRWTQAGGLQVINNGLGGTRSDGSAITLDGTTIAGSATTTGNARQRVFRLVGGQMQDLGVTTGQTAFGLGISGDGSTVVGWATDAGAEMRPMRWTAPIGMQDLGTLGGTRGASLDASRDGTVVVGWARDVAGTSVPFRWTAATGMTALAGMATPSGEARGISLDGQVVVGAFTGGAFRWTMSGGMLTLAGLPGMPLAEAQDVSGDGSVVVGHATEDTFTNESAFVWTAAAGTQDLNTVFSAIIPQGYHLTHANSISADGRWIAGIAHNPAGAEEAFLVGPLP